MTLIDYAFKDLANHILITGNKRQVRNGEVFSIFGYSFTYDMSINGFPIMQSRRIPFKSAAGELEAFLNKPKKVEDFTSRGCKYWTEYGDAEGNLELDYGNAWLDWNGVNQLVAVEKALKENPTDRRMIISGWRPDRLNKLSLPCCHILYQFYCEDKFVDMVWYQRSADVALGLSVDFVTAGLLLALIANAANKLPRRIIFMLGDAHIYQKHVKTLIKQLELINNSKFEPVAYMLNMLPGISSTFFTKDLFEIFDYEPKGDFKYELFV